MTFPREFQLYKDETVLGPNYVLLSSFVKQNALSELATDMKYHYKSSDHGKKSLEQINDELKEFVSENSDLLNIVVVF